MSYEKKPLEKLNVMDNFLTNKLSTHELVKERFCRLMMRALLGREAGRISIQTEYAIPGITPDLRGIRMDVEIEEYEKNDSLSHRDKGTSEQSDDSPRIKPRSVYDFEPHNRNDTFLPKRNRFYQARRDGRYLEAGVIDFRELPELIMVSILPYDPFGYNQMVYTINNKCEEVPELEYGDELEFVYFYTKGRYGGTEELRRFLKYMEDSREENVVDENTRLMHELVSVVKLQPEVEDEYMTWGEYIDSERRDERAEATRAAKISSIIELLEDYGTVPNSILDILNSIDNSDEFSRIHKLAARAGSIEAFSNELLVK